VTSHEGISEYDLTIVFLASQQARQSSTRARRELSSLFHSPPSPPLPISDFVKASLQSILNKPAQSKIAKYTPLLSLPFSPLVISLGGMMEDSTVEAMEAWKGVMGVASHQYLMRRISVVLARARARV
jgi:hypothetical protein